MSHFVGNTTVGVFILPEGRYIGKGEKGVSSRVRTQPAGYWLAISRYRRQGNGGCRNIHPTRGRASIPGASPFRSLRITIKTVAEDDGRHVQVRLSDNGPGMEPEVLNKATNLFFSAHPAGRKRGLGLSRVYRYAQANHGTLWLESQPGEGTTAFIRLPSGSANG